MRVLPMLLLLFAAAVQAHEGHDHGAQPQPAAGSAAPRFETRSDLFELVGVLQGEELVLYLDHAGDNTPIMQAEIELEAGAFKGQATPNAVGEFRLRAGPLAKPGKHALTISIATAADADLLTADFAHGTAAAAPSAGAGAWSALLAAGPLSYGAAGLLLLLGIPATRRLVRRRPA